MLKQSRQRIVEEGLGEDGLVVLARMGQDPGGNYFMSLTSDLKQLFDELQGKRLLDRELCHALFCLGCYVESEYRSWMEKGVEMRNDLMNDVFQMMMAIESIFNDVWIE